MQLLHRPSFRWICLPLKLSSRSPTSGVLLCLLLLGMSMSPLWAKAADLSVEKTDRGVTVKIDGELFTEYLIKSGAKPILWPIIGPTGKPITRAYPMANVAGEKRDHPHQRSLWFTHGDVNGVDFWTEGNRHGTIVHRSFEDVSSSGAMARIVTKNDWMGPDGRKHCTDVRTLQFGAGADSRWIDFDITLTAADGPATFGDTKEGSFGVRVPTSMDVDSKKGGRIVNAVGQTDDAAWGKPAPWVDYHGPVDDATVGIAILNHPSSFRFPTHWHVRTYGLFAANPFGLHDFEGGTPGKGAHTLPQGESMHFRYRVIFHKGDEKQAGIAQAFEAFARDRSE